MVMTREQMEEEIRTLEEGVKGLQMEKATMQLKENELRDKIEELELLLYSDTRWIPLTMHYCKIAIPSMIMGGLVTWLYFCQ